MGLYFNGRNGEADKEAKAVEVSTAGYMESVGADA